MGWNTVLWTQARTLLKGQTLTEYALIMLAVGLAAFFAFATMGGDINAVTEILVKSLNTAVSQL